MGIFTSQNPGIGGIDELTDSEAIFIQQIVSSPKTDGDVLSIVSGEPSWGAPTGGFPTNVYVENIGTLSSFTSYTFTHNLNVTESDVEMGKYKVVITGSRGGYGYQFGDTSADSFWGGTTHVSIRHLWSTGVPSSSEVFWQADTAKVTIGTTTLTSCTFIIQRMW